MPNLTHKDKVIRKRQPSVSNRFTILESSVATMHREKSSLTTKGNKLIPCRYTNNTKMIKD